MSGLHVGIIMDGNGRWGLSRCMPRSAGHRAGARALREVVEAAPDAGVSTLTVYAFSADNWRRPPEEVGLLLRLFRGYLRSERAACQRNGVRVSVLGRRDRLPPLLRREIALTERQTAAGTTLHLRVAIDYSSREAILAAAARCGQEVDSARFEQLLVADQAHRAPPVDLLIRTGGEYRLSDFLLWESAYAELLFSPVMWPDFGKPELREAVVAFRQRDRRFGAITPAVMAQAGAA